jgi:hypothetical protein
MKLTASAGSVGRSRSRGRWAVRAAALAAVAGSLALAPTATAQAAPDPSTCPQTVVHSAELVRTTSGPAILVHGVAAGPNVNLFLVPEDVVYIRQPEYWRYFVVDCAPDPIPSKTAYTKVFRVPTSPVGSLGITIGPDEINL